MVLGTYAVEASGASATRSGTKPSVIAQVAAKRDALAPVEEKV